MSTRFPAPSALTPEVIDPPPDTEAMSTPTQPQTGADVMAQFIPSSPFVAKLGIVADVLDADEVRLRLPWDPTNVTIADMVHGGAIAALADVAVMAAAWAGAEYRTRCAA